MRFIELPLSGAYLIELEPFQDERGIFVRTFCQREFAVIGFHKPIVQSNCSITRQRGTIRGMHYQLPPAGETKIIRCVRGEVFDVLVDLRSSSHTFLQWHGVRLSSDGFQMVHIPEGFAHGFQALSDDVELHYLTSACYSPEHERGVRFDDPALAIAWPLPPGSISQKDQYHPLIDAGFKGMA